MKNCTQAPLITELQRAISEGYVHYFLFIENELCCITDKAKRYSIPEVNIFPRPCLLTQTTIYRIRTPEDIMGFAMLDWKEIEQCSVDFP
jgi:hypothetical protein